MKIGTKVRLTEEAKNDTYFDMDWKDDEGLGCIYSFSSITSDKEITCSMYSYELDVI